MARTVVVKKPIRETTLPSGIFSRDLLDLRAHLTGPNTIRQRKEVKRVVSNEERTALELPETCKTVRITTTEATYLVGKKPIFIVDIVQPIQSTNTDEEVVAAADAKYNTYGVS
jgi:hypothetical protein